MVMTFRIRLFVYGTLRRGFANHDRFCRGVLAIENASIAGRLRWLSPRIPMAQVPPGSVLAEGSADPARDAVLQAKFPRQPARNLSLSATGDVGGPWGLVSGEILTFDDPELRIPPIDDLEGFRPGGRSLYRRVLVPLASGVGAPVWVYVAPEEGEEEKRWRR